MKDVGWHGDTLKADGHVFLVQPRDCEEFATANDAAIQDVREEMATPLMGLSCHWGRAARKSSHTRLHGVQFFVDIRAANRKLN
jgi:hypothetical protein